MTMISRDRAQSIVYRIRSSRGAVIISLLLCVIIFFQLVKVFSKSAKTDDEIRQLQEESMRLAEEQRYLEDLSSFLQTDFFAEREARTKFGFKKEGETALIITTPEALRKSADGGTARGQEESDRTIAEQPHRTFLGVGGNMWWNYFFGQ